MHFTNIVHGRWEPWNPVMTAVVRRVVNPIPMYAKCAEAKIPILDQHIGYDLMAGDWLVPYGKGSTPDLLFKFHRRVTNQADYEQSIHLSFPRDSDGIQEQRGDAWPGSDFRFSRYAPDKGYGKDYGYTRGLDPQKGRYGDQDPANRVYFIRVRSKLDETGKLKEAYYGKIIGSIELAGVGTDNFRVSFTYYLNPTPNGRNMEFDPGRNLLKNIALGEQVQKP